jgi:hypothetical protein
MKNLLIAGFCLAIALSGCKGKSEVKTKGSSDQPFGVYQGGIDRAKEVQQKSVTRSATEDSAAAAAKDGAQGQ